MLCTEVTGAGPRRLGPGDSKSPPAADGIASFGQCPGPGTDWQPASDSESEPASGTVTELELALRLSDSDHWHDRIPLAGRLGEHRRTMII